MVYDAWLGGISMLVWVPKWECSPHTVISAVTGWDTFEYEIVPAPTKRQISEAKLNTSAVR
jgi:hypothetical protein